MKKPFENLHNLANKAREQGWVGGKKENKAEQIDKKVSIREAQEVMGEENFYGPIEIYQTFGTALGNFKNIPDKVPFSKAELERAKELGQELILYIDRAKNDEPLTAKKMKEILVNKTSKGTPLVNSDWFETDAVVGKETPRLGWRLSEKEPLKASGGRDYIGQTEEIINHLTDVIFTDENSIPKEYEEAIQEFDSIKASLHSPAKSSNPDEWKPAAEKLVNLKINQLCRENFSEVIYRMALHEKKHGERLLDYEGRDIYYIWTNSRDAVGRLVMIGDFGANGLSVGGWHPRTSDSSLGVCLSRS